MESYQTFLNRIDSFEKPELILGDGYFSVNPSVERKVCEDNSFRGFYGDTVVFDLDEKEKAVIREYVNLLYQSAPECFCERLAGNTFHMTLHDLSNSPVQEDVADSMQSNECKLKELLMEYPVESQTIKMQSKAVFNMVNTSLVIGLYPVDEQEYLKLIKLYQLINTVKELPYPLTPHITLAYYNRAGFDRTAAQQLEQTVNQLNNKSIEILLNTERLVYQHFQNMNDYHAIFYLKEMCR